MLDFLKTVLGDAYTDEIDKAISEEIGKGFVARADFNALKDSKKGLEEQLKTANETISGFKDMDIEGVKAEAEKYRIAAEQAEKDAAEKIAAMQFDALLDGAIGEVKGKNAKAVKALLDVDALRASKNQADDIKAALEAVAKDSPYLFDGAAAPAPYAAGTGMTPPTAPGGVESEFAKLNPTIKI